MLNLVKFAELTEHKYLRKKILKPWKVSLSPKIVYECTESIFGHFIKGRLCVIILVIVICLYLNVDNRGDLQVMNISGAYRKVLPTRACYFLELHVAFFQPAQTKILFRELS